MLGNSNTTEQNNYNKHYLGFRLGAKDSNPYFSVNADGKTFDVTKVSGVFKGIFHNPEMEKLKKDGTPFTAQENFVIILVDGENQYNIQIDTRNGNQLRAVLNSLLSAELGDSIELATYIAKGQYKVISVTNPDKKKEIKYEKNGEEKTATVNENYPWKFEMKDIPQVEVSKNSKGKVVDVDDEDANNFFKEKILEKFSNSSNTSNDSGEVNIEDVPF